MPSNQKKLFWLAFWVAGFAIFMTGLLLYFKYQSVFTGLQRERMLLVAGEIDDIAEKNLTLGQDFWEIATLQDVIERRRSADPLLLGIEVAGRDGRIAYATDLSRMGSNLPADWLQAFAATAKVSRLSPSPDEAVVAATIRNSFDQVAGYAVVRYSRQPEHAAMRTFTSRLLLTGAALFGLFTLLLFATLRWLWQRTDHALTAAAAMPDDGRTARLPPLLAREMAAVESQLESAQQQLSAAATGLTR